jgi:hypothetical protein
MAKNLDDGIDRLESDAGKISGRSARIKRRVDMILEEIRGVQLHLALNVVIFIQRRFVVGHYQIRVCFSEDVTPFLQ